MSKSRKNQLLIVLILACTCAPGLTQEPNQPETELKFETSNEAQPWRINMRLIKGWERSQIKPTHVAVFRVENRTSYPGMYFTELAHSTIGQTMSQKQWDFLGRYALAQDSYSDGQNLIFQWYGVSKDDAEKTARCFLEAWTNRVKARVQSLKSELAELQKKIVEAKKEISEKERQAQTAKPKLDELQETGHYLSFQEAGETISELNKTLNTLNIEIAGMNAKLRAIQEHQKLQKQKAKIYKEPEEKMNREGILLKLEQMLIEQAIELRATEAKEETATVLRNQAEMFREIYESLGDAHDKKRELTNSLSRYEKDLRNVEEKLANPTPDMLPPKVFQNKVTIYPVRLDE